MRSFGTYAFHHCQTDEKSVVVFLYGEDGRCADNFNIVVVCRNKEKHFNLFVCKVTCQKRSFLLLRLV